MPNSNYSVAPRTRKWKGKHFILLLSERYNLCSNVVIAYVQRLHCIAPFCHTFHTRLTFFQVWMHPFRNHYCLVPKEIFVWRALVFKFHKEANVTGHGFATSSARHFENAWITARLRRFPLSLVFRTLSWNSKHNTGYYNIKQNFTVANVLIARL